MLTFENTVSFAKDQKSGLALRNFWDPEDGFVWSTGKWCEFAFSFDQGTRPYVGRVDLIIDVDAFKDGTVIEGQNLLLYFNGLRVGSTFCSRRSTLAFVFDAKWLAKIENTIIIDTPDSARPSQFGSADDRLLGLQLFSVQMRKVE